MKNLITFSLITLGLSAYSQTNRINHYSHSGSSSTLEIFSSNDNMGLGCGSAYGVEYVPDSTIKLLPDSIQIDTTKNKVCKPTPIKKAETPRRGMSLQSKFDVESVLGKFN